MVGELIGNDLLRVVEVVRTLCWMLHSLNTTFFAMILNVDRLVTFKHSQPISLCNSIFKFMKKIIAFKLNPKLLEVISEDQFGFLKHRPIHKCISIVQEGLHYINKALFTITLINIDFLSHMIGCHGLFCIVTISYRDEL